MSEKPISPLRQRMIEDMMVRQAIRNPRAPTQSTQIQSADCFVKTGE